MVRDFGAALGLSLSPATGLPPSRGAPTSVHNGVALGGRAEPLQLLFELSPPPQPPTAGSTRPTVDLHLRFLLQPPAGGVAAWAVVAVAPPGLADELAGMASDGAGSPPPSTPLTVGVPAPLSLALPLPTRGPLDGGSRTATVRWDPATWAVSGQTARVLPVLPPPPPAGAPPGDGLGRGPPFELVVVPLVAGVHKLPHAVFSGSSVDGSGGAAEVVGHSVLVLDHPAGAYCQGL